MGFFSNLLKPKKTFVVINWNLPDELTSDLKEKEYDVDESVRAFLKKRKIEPSKIEKIMAKRNPLDEAIKMYNKPQLNSYDLYCDESIRTMYLLYLRFIQDTKGELVFDYTVTYIAYKLAQFYNWNIRTGQGDPSFMNEKILNYMKTNNYEELMKYFTKDVFICFAYAHKVTGKTVKEAADVGIEYLKLNSQHINSALGSFCITYGIQNVEGLIYKVLEAAYNYHKFSVGTILKKAK